VLLFWGNGRILWLSLVGVIVLATLFIRMGIAHFEREYLLGREIDTLNLRWIWSTFWAFFRSGTRQDGSWHRRAVLPAMRHLVMPVLVMLVLLVGGGWVGYSQVTSNAPDFFKDSSVKTIDDLREQVSNMPVADGMNGVEISAPFIFLNNVRATAAMFLVGVFSFGVLGILFYLLNAGLIGGILSLFAYVGISPWLLFSSGILPHGMFELPALILSGAAVLRMAVALVTPQTGKSMGEVFLSLIADWAKVFIGVIVPLLLVASLIETYVTPAILHSVLNW
jgi:uncharacterized membrane protein SpoIIM required for sporulation